MSEKRVVRPRAKTAASKVVVREEETSPGDVIEMSLTVEMTGKRGAKTWAKAGLASSHRPEETSEQAVDRVQSFVVASVEALQEEMA